MAKDKERTLEVANLICRFGDHKVLLDLAEEVVIPAFLDGDLVRNYDDTSYFFLNAKKVTLNSSSEPPVIGIVGRIIKDTTIRREQIYAPGKGLVKSEDALQSSPSAIFLLILNNHRLVYVAETKDAPSKETFRSTLLSFIRQKHQKFIEELHEKRNDESLSKITKKSLSEEFPRPTIELVPLTSESDIESFVKKYETLKVLEIKLLDRNDENDNDAFFEELQKRKDDLKSKISVVRHSSPEGLDIQQAVDEITEATQQGNQKVTLAGIDQNGDVLRGNNEKFQVRTPIEGLKRGISAAATQLYQTFSTLVEDGTVKLPKLTERTRKIVSDLSEKFPNE